MPLAIISLLEQKHKKWSFCVKTEKDLFWSLHWWPEIEVCWNLLSPSKWKFTAATEKRELVLTTVSFLIAQAINQLCSWTASDSENDL